MGNIKTRGKLRDGLARRRAGLSLTEYDPGMPYPREHVGSPGSLSPSPTGYECDHEPKRRHVTR